MKDELKSAAKGIALGAALIALASILWGCQAMPPVTVVGQYGNYSYSSKGGITIAPRFQRIILYPTK
jgi:hypothetical protein